MNLEQAAKLTDEQITQRLKVIETWIAMEMGAVRPSQARLGALGAISRVLIIEQTWRQIEQKVKALEDKGVIAVTSEEAREEEKENRDAMQTERQRPQKPGLEQRRTKKDPRRV